MNQSKQNTSRKTLAHNFAAKLSSQSSDNPNHISIKRTIDDFASVKDELANISNCGFSISKLAENSKFVILETNSDESGDLYAIPIPTKLISIDDLDEGDIRYYNPNADGNFIDLKSNGGVEITTKNSKIALKTSGEISIKSESCEVKIETSGKISIGNGACELVDAVFQIAKLLSTTSAVGLGSPISSASDFAVLMGKLSSLKS